VTKSRVYRIITAVSGLAFLMMAIAILLTTDRSIGPVVAALIIGALGVDAMISAWRNKPALLSRIGPLP
jgi:hypothetical protein